MSYSPDLYWRGGIEEVFPELLCLVFKDAPSIFDLDRKAEFLDKELQRIFPEAGEKPDNRYVDKLAKVFRKDGTPEYVLIHLEVQGYDAGDFALRLFTYFYRLFERYKVPITSVSLFTTLRMPEGAGAFDYEMMGTKLHFEYNAIHIFDYTEAELLAMKSGLGIMILAAQKALLRKKMDAYALNQERLMLAKALLACKQYDKDKILALIAFVKNLLYIDNREINLTFDEEIHSLNKNIAPMGILELIAEKGREKGREEGREEGIEMKSREIVIALIEQLGLDDEMAAGVAKVSVAYVQQIRKEIKG